MSTSNPDIPLSHESSSAMSDTAFDTIVNYGGQLIDIQRFIGINDY